MMQRLQDKAWREFAAWCASRGLKALPAHPWTVAAYMRWCEPRQKLPNIVESLKSITRMHLLKCHKTPERHATVMKILRQIEIRALNKDTRAALFRAEDFAQVTHQALQQETADATPSDIPGNIPGAIPNGIPGDVPGGTPGPSGENRQNDRKTKRIMRNSPRLVRRLERRNAT